MAVLCKKFYEHKTDILLAKYNTNQRTADEKENVSDCQ